MLLSQKCKWCITLRQYKRISYKDLYISTNSRQVKFQLNAKWSFKKKREREKKITIFLLFLNFIQPIICLSPILKKNSLPLNGTTNDNSATNKEIHDQGQGIK